MRDADLFGPLRHHHHLSQHPSFFPQQTLVYIYLEIIRYVLTFFRVPLSVVLYIFV
jgi:hypothetical protein